MTKRPSPPADSPAPGAAPAPRRPAQSWVGFWFTPVDPIGLHALRALAGLLFLGWLIVFAGHYPSLFGLQGWFDLPAYREAVRLREGPPVPITWSALYLCGNNPQALAAAYWASLGALVLFTLGVWPRLTSVLAWVVVASFSATPAVSYSGDYLLVILAFYITIGYLLLGQWSRGQTRLTRLLGTNEGSLLARWLPAGRAARPQPSHGANLALRLLQVHFAIAIVASGLHKLQFGDWWTGAALWYPVNRPFDLTMEKLRAQSANATSNLIFISIASYAVLGWQLAFPLFAWRRAWRLLLLAGGVVAWAGCSLLYKEPLFGPVFFLATLTYLTAAEWRRALDLLGRLPRLLRRSTGEAARAGRPVGAGVMA